jgi:hypothetical protein
MAAPPIRFTLDVDVITEVATLAEYYRLAEHLHDRGFKRKTPAMMLRFAAGKRAVSFCDGIPDIFQSLLLGNPY